MDWALSPTDWRLIGSSEMYNINDIESDEKKIKDFKDKTFYKERWIKENGLEQRLIVTYSLKYKNYQRKIAFRYKMTYEKMNEIFFGNRGGLNNERERVC